MMRVLAATVGLLLGLRGTPARGVRRRKLQDDEAFGFPGAFQCLGCTAAHEIPAAVYCDGWRGENLVVIVGGLIVDRYADWLVIQALTLYIDMQKQYIADLLAELLPGQAKRDITTGQAKAMLATVRPRDIAGKTRRRIAARARPS